MKVFKFLIPIVFLLVAVLIMISGKFLKNAYHGNQIPTFLDEISIDIKEDKWDEAINKTDIIKTRYNKIIKLIQFSVERGALIEFKDNLSILAGYLNSQDENNAQAIVYYLKSKWKDLY